MMYRDPLTQFEVEKREHEIKMHKMENEMEEVFEMKVQEKLQKLKDIEADVSICLPRLGLARLRLGLAVASGLARLARVSLARDRVN